MRGKVKFLLTRTKPSLFIKPLLHPKYFKFSSVLQQLNRRGMFSIYHIFYIYRSLMVSVSIYICKYIDSCKVAIHITSVFVIWFFFFSHVKDFTSFFDSGQNFILRKRKCNHFHRNYLFSWYKRPTSLWLFVSVCQQNESVWSITSNIQVVGCLTYQKVCVCI